jgi:hypothetical protein
LLREEQERITLELADAQEVVGTTEGGWTIIERNVNHALDLLADRRGLSRIADPVARKALNQAFFRRPLHRC